MNKVKYFISLFIVAFLLTGCVKFNVNMDIKKDKSMDLSIIYAIDKELNKDDSLLDEDSIKEYKKNGYKLEKYEDEKKSGYKITKRIKNIDKISTKKLSKSDLKNIGEDENTKLFKVKKGLFKNRYYSNFYFNEDETDEEISEEQDESDILEEDDEDYYEDYVTNEETEDNYLDDIDYDNIDYTMDLSFTIKLPYSAINHNATKTKNNERELTWTLNESAKQDIEFEFELYNYTNIIICALLVIILIGGIVFVILKCKKKK